MPAYTIPTIFTAVDQYSKKVVGMTGVTNMLTNSVGKATMSLVTYGAAALAVGGIMVSGKGILEYQTEIQNLSAVTGAAGSQLDSFKNKITDVAIATKKSTVEVAQAFTNVDNNMPQLHKDIEGLGEVTKETIVLAKAGRMELGASAESLTMSMNQFGLGAKDAKMAIDALASGAVAGSSRIAETSDAIQKFGTVAANVAHITYAESVALVELGSKFEKGSEAGTRFRNMLLNMTNIKSGPAADIVAGLGVDLDKVSNTALSLSERLHEIAKIKDSPEAMEKLFDKRNVAMAAGVFSLIDKYDEVLKTTQRVGAAEEMAAKNTDTLQESVNQLGAAWVTHITTAKTVNAGVYALQGGVKFLTNNLDALLTVAEIGIGIWGAYKVALITTKTAVWALNFAEGVAVARTAQLGVVTLTTTSAIQGYTIATRALSIGLLPIAGAAGLAAGALYLFGSAMSSTYNSSTELNDSLTKTVDGVKQVAKETPEATLALNAYNDAVEKYNSRKSAKERLEYHQKYNKAHNREDTWGDFIMQLPDVFRAGIDDRPTEAPKREDFNVDGSGSTPSAPAVPDLPTSFNNTHNISLDVNVNKDGNVDVAVNSNGSTIPVKVINSRNARGAQQSYGV